MVSLAEARRRRGNHWQPVSVAFAVSAQELNKISGMIVDAAIGIHSELGPGLLESVYEIVLAHELKERGFRVERQVPVPINFRGICFEEAYRLDLLVEDQIIIEIKSVESVTGVHKKQLLTYLKLLNKPLGLLLNFNTVLMKSGITRTVNNLRES